MPQPTPTIAELRHFAVTHSLAAPTTLAKALARLAFVQADPIRAPARAQDLTLRHRVKNYRAGDLEAKYSKLGIEEDFLINHGFMPHKVHALMHPRVYNKGRWTLVKKHSANLLAYVREHGIVHPRDVDTHFAHGSMRNGWGGQSSVTTQLLDGMHYRGMLRIAGRDKGIRLYGMPHREHAPRSRSEIDAALDQLLDVVINKYAPIPARSIAGLLGRVRLGVPQWQRHMPAALSRAKARMAHAVIDGVTWYWPEGADFRAEADATVRLLAPFDPIVWDRTRFAHFWDWEYRFEAYTPAAKRKLGYYALPMLWRDRVIGWANLSVADGALATNTGYVSGRAPREAAFKRELDAELERMKVFLRL